MSVWHAGVGGGFPGHIRAMSDDVWLDIPCPSCGEYALEAEVVLRDVALRVQPGAGGRVAVAVTSADANLAAAAWHACGDAVDQHGDVGIAVALEDATEAWLARLAG